MNTMTNDNDLNTRTFAEHLILTFLIMGVCRGLCILCHAAINSAGNFFHYDMYGSYLASSITTATLVAISIIMVFIHRKYLKNHAKPE